MGGAFSDFNISSSTYVKPSAEATSKGLLRLGKNVSKLNGNEICDNLKNQPIFGKAFETELNPNTSTTYTSAFAGLNDELNSISIQSTFSKPKASQQMPGWRVMAEHFLKITPGATSDEITQMSEISNTVFADSMPGKIGDAVRASTNVQKSLSTDDFPSTLDTHFKAHDLLTLTNFGCKEHNVGLNVYKEENGKFTVVLCNRGFGSEEGMFLEKTLDSIETCKQFLNTLKESKEDKTMDNVVNQFRTNDGNLNSIDKDLQQAQVMGNCGWANKAAALKELSNRRASVEDYKTFRSKIQDKVESDIKNLGNEKLKMALELRTLIKEHTGPIKLELKKLENNGALSDIDFNGLSRQLTDEIRKLLPTLLSDKENSSLDHAKPILKRYQQFVKLGLDISKPGPNNKFLVNTYNFLNTLDTKDTKELQSDFNKICNDRIEDSMPKLRTKGGDLREPLNFINDIKNKKQNFDDETLKRHLKEKVKEFSIKHRFLNNIEKEDGKTSYMWSSPSKRSLEAEVLFKLSQSKSQKDATVAFDSYNKLKDFQKQLNQEGFDYASLNEEDSLFSLTSLYEPENAVGLQLFREHIKTDFENPEKYDGKIKDNVWTTTNENKWLFNLYTAKNATEAQSALNSRSTT